MNGLAVALLVGAGGALGAISRYAVGTRFPGPTATLLVNVLGSAGAGGILAAGVPDTVAAMAAVGFCGAFTTFSSFAVEVADRLDRGDRYGAGWYAGATLATAVLGAVVGIVVVTWLS